MSSNPNANAPSPEGIITALAALVGPAVLRQLVVCDQVVGTEIVIAVSGDSVDVSVAGGEPMHFEKESVLGVITQAEQATRPLPSAGQS